MSTTTYGQPATIDQAPTPPAPVNILSSTNASPTVITTASAHGLHTGQAVIVAGHLLNTNADGTWIATVVDSTRFKISSFSDFPGTFVNGNNAGTNTGTVQSLALPGVTLPEDAVDDCDASSVNVPFEFNADALAWLVYKILASMTILRGGVLVMQQGSRLENSVGSRLNIGFTNLTDADHTVNAGTDGPTYILAQPTTARTITIAQASDPDKITADVLEFWLPKPASDPSVGYYAIKREGSGNNIAILSGKYFPTAGSGDAYPGFCRVHLSGGVWRLSGGAGVNYDTDA